MITNCELSRRFRACRRPGVAACQYCGRTFCSEHGDCLSDGQDICHTKTCERKKEDLIQHLAYREAAGERNKAQRCGQEHCEEQPRGGCSKCHGLFCDAHVQERNVETRDAAMSRGSVCAHCHKRRKLWSRR